MLHTIMWREMILEVTLIHIWTSSINQAFYSASKLMGAFYDMIFVGISLRFRNVFNINMLCVACDCKGIYRNRKGATIASMNSIHSLQLYNMNATGIVRKMQYWNPSPGAITSYFQTRRLTTLNRREKK